MSGYNNSIDELGREYARRLSTMKKCEDLTLFVGPDFTGAIDLGCLASNIAKNAARDFEQSILQCFFGSDRIVSCGEESLLDGEGGFSRFVFFPGYDIGSVAFRVINERHSENIEYCYIDPMWYQLLIQDGELVYYHRSMPGRDWEKVIQQSAAYRSAKVSKKLPEAQKPNIEEFPEGLLWSSA